MPDLFAIRRWMIAIAVPAASAAMLIFGTIRNQDELYAQHPLLVIGLGVIPALISLPILYHALGRMKRGRRRHRDFRPAHPAVKFTKT